MKTRSFSLLKGLIALSGDLRLTPLSAMHYDHLLKALRTTGMKIGWGIPKTPETSSQITIGRTALGGAAGRGPSRAEMYSHPMPPQIGEERNEPASLPIAGRMGFRRALREIDLNTGAFPGTGLKDRAL